MRFADPVCGHVTVSTWDRKGFLTALPGLSREQST